ncbi:MAG: M20 family metallopeptidase [Candidatus Omnitrophica bacterium]|nr:M20 family metallopeptidase [Candidatus Omnitrophota bacterium]
MKANLLKYLKINKSDLVSLVSQLVEIPTVNPPGEHYEKMVGFLEKRCKRIGLKTKRFLTPRSVLEKSGVKNGSKRISLVADWKTSSKKTLHMASHYDVVPATDKWRTPPFKAIVRGNRIYGRGSEDMKGNIACVLSALESMKKCGVRPKVNLQVSFTPDEEIGGATGLGYLIKKNLVKADYAITEGHSGFYVSMGNKGVLWAEVMVEGKASHASLPHKGINAFERAAELVMEFKKLKKKLSRRKTSYHMIDDVSRSPSFVMGGLVEGGAKPNILPGRVLFSIDRRLIPEEDAFHAAKEIKGVIKRFNARYKDSKVHVKFITKQNPSISLRDEEFFRATSESIRSVIGKKATFTIMSGATDIRYFMRRGVPSLGYGAKGGESWHSDDEFVYIDSLVDTVKVYVLLMSGLGRSNI